MRLFIRYGGGKHRLARHYGRPFEKVLIEPFAGGAGMATYWEHPKVILIDKDPRIFNIWNWLINEATYDDIMDLDGSLHDVRECDYPQHVKDFISFFFERGSFKPPYKLPPNNKHALIKNPGSFWSDATKKSIAKQLHKIENWEVIHGDYTEAPDIEAYWFIDPPYEVQGGLYGVNNNDIDYQHLAEWSKSRKGSGVVCEGAGATWLPFEPLREIRTQVADMRMEYVYWLNKPDYSELFE